MRQRPDADAIDAALGLLAPDGKSFVNVEVKREDKSDTSELMISHTLLTEVIEEKKALAFMDVSVDEKLSRAQSIIMQGIRSILCAPVTIGDAVVGVLYVDYLINRQISEDDVRLVAQIARYAAIKLETTRLRDEAIQKRIMDEELKTASVIQRRLLPPAPTGITGYTLVGANHPGERGFDWQRRKHADDQQRHQRRCLPSDESGAGHVAFAGQ